FVRLLISHPPSSTLCPYTTLFRSVFRCGSAREGRWWRCSRSALVEGTPGLLVEGGGAAERRSRAPGRSTSRVTGFPVWLVERGPLVALQPLGARRGHAGAGRGAWWRGGAPSPRAGPLDVEGDGFSGVARRERAVGGAAAARRSSRARRGCSSRVVARPSAVAARRAARRRG